MTSTRKRFILEKNVDARVVGDPRSFLFVVPLWWALSLFVVPNISEPRVFAVAMMANALAFSVTLGVLLLFRSKWLQKPSRTSLPIIQVVLVGALLGSIKSCVTVAVTVLTLSETSSWELLVSRVPGGAFTGAWILPVAALLMSTRERYQAQRDILVAELLRNQFLTKPVSSTVVLEDSTDALVRGVISQAKRILNQASLPPAVAAKKLRNLIETQLRPISHKLWADTSRKFTDFSFLDLFRIVLTQRRYWVLPTTVFIAISNGPFVISVAGWEEGLGRTGIIAATAFLMLTALNRGKTSGVLTGMIWLFVGALVFTSVNELIAYAFFGPFSSWNPTVSGLANAAVFVANALIFGLLLVARQDNQEIRRGLESLLGVSSWRERFDGEMIRLRHRELAELLHGSVQNRLLAVVLALTSHPDTSKRDDVIAELDHLEESIFGDEQRKESEIADDLDSEFAALADRWQGIATVSVMHEMSQRLDAALLDTIVKIGEEAVSNAVRHGFASTVEIRAIKEDSDIVVTVVDNGVGPRNGKPGLGTLYLVKFAGTRWALTAGPEGAGSELTVRLSHSAL